MLQVAVVHKFRDFEPEVWPAILDTDADPNGKFEVQILHKNDNEAFFNRGDTDKVKVGASTDRVSQPLLRGVCDRLHTLISRHCGWWAAVDCT